MAMEAPSDVLLLRSFFGNNMWFGACILRYSSKAVKKKKKKFNLKYAARFNRSHALGPGNEVGDAKRKPS